MKIYTRRGDDGTTGLFGGGRVAKDHPRVAAYGTVDELNSVLGWALAVGLDAGIRDRLAPLQHDLLAIGAVLSSPPPEAGRRGPEVPRVPVERIVEMEGWMDEADAELPPLREFVLPGGTPGSAALHVGRTVCRRAERAAVALVAESGEAAELREAVIPYLNRLSDLLFVMARLEAHRRGAGEVTWRKEDAP